MTGTDAVRSEPRFLHVPCVTKGSGDGVWRTYCQACSYDADNHVEACKGKSAKDEYWPPPILIAASCCVGDTQRLNGHTAMCDSQPGGPDF